MNKVILIGRLTKDPDIRFTNGERQLAIARYTLAVDRRGKDTGADYVSCIAFDKGAEFAERYLKKGTKIAITGHIQTGSYTNNEGKKVYTTDVVVESHEFVESRSSSTSSAQTSNGFGNGFSQDGFASVPENVDDAGLPFN